MITRETDPLTTALECERRAGLIEDMLSIPDVEITERQRAEGLREIGIAEWRVKRTDYGWRVSVEWIDNSERECSATGRDSVIGTAWAVVLGMVQRALQAEARELREMAEEEAA